MAASPSDNGKVATPERAIVPAGATRQMSFSGTLRGRDGITTPDDYVRELADPVRRMEMFEEMGNDDAVHTAIDARRQEINAANWQLSTEDETPLGTEILEFVEDNVYPLLDDLLRWLGGGALQYGFSAIEPVYQWADRPPAAALAKGKVQRATKSGAGRRIYLAKLAHIRPRAVTSFLIAEETGDLEALRQEVFTGTKFLRRDIPAEKVLLWTYNRQGDDFWGVPPTRHCYKGWKFKTQIERLNLLHIDKFGVGTPVAEEGEGWSTAERDRLAAYLESWRSGANNYILHPMGGKISIVSDEGKSTMSALEWVKYYNLAVAKTYLTQATELGSTETGARALGESFFDQLGGIVQADCEELAALINNQLIVPLVRYNFGEQDAYPTFAPSQRVKAGAGIATMMKQMIDAGIVHVRPEDEMFVRDLLELPSVSIDDLKTEQEARDAKAADISRQTVGPGPGDGQPNRKPGSPPAAGDGPPGPRRVAAMRQLSYAIADGAPTAAERGKTTWRTPEFAAWEDGILKPDALMQELELQTARTAGEVTDVLRAIDADLERQVSALAGKGTAALSAGVRTIAVPDRLRSQLRKALLTAAERARSFGATAVRNEIERQLGPSGIGPQRAPAFYPGLYSTRALATEQTPEDLHLGAQVDRAVEDEIDRRESSARSSVLTVIAQAGKAAVSVIAGVAAQAIKSALTDLSTGRTQQNVQEVVNAGFGIGRSEEAQAIVDAPAGGGGRSGLRDGQGNPIELVAKVYSAVMDLGTCDECAKWDGAEFPMDYPEDLTGVQCPNPRCAGGFSRCRCVWIYITDRESVPLVPAAKGPQPIRRNAA